MRDKVLVAQGGGPTVVINQSLVGVVLEARKFRHIERIYGARHGVRGIVDEDLVDLTRETSHNLELVADTPSSALGSTRDKPDCKYCQAIFKTLQAHGIGYFLYIGGNDSMDTANKVAQLARERGLDLVGVGVPKTIDNDVGDSAFKLIDHTPGYGSVAKYWMHMVQTANEENRGSCPADPVLVMQAMGRKIGYIPAAARLADPHREMPLQIYLAESPCTLEQMADQVNDQLRKDGRCMVVVSEGFSVGEIGEVRDSFGHVMFSSSQLTVAQSVTNYLNKVGLAAKGAARCNVPGTDQRHAMALASVVDLEEAYKSGQLAALLAARGESGYMSTILRNPGPIYNVRYDRVPLAEVANSERTFPTEWITGNGNDVSDDFVRYAKPLVGEGMLSMPLVDGRYRMTRFQPLYAKQKLPKYVPQADRKK